MSNYRRSSSSGISSNDHFIGRSGSPKTESIEDMEKHLSRMIERSKEDNKQLLRDNKRLRDERHGLREELNAYKTDNEELMKKCNHFSDLKERNKSLNSELTKFKTDREEYIKKEQRFVAFNKQVEEYKLRKKYEINKLNDNRVAHLEKIQLLENKNRVLNQEKEEILHKLSAEKEQNNQMNTESLHLLSTINGLKSTINSQLKENVDLKNAFKRNNESLISKKAFDELTQKCDRLERDLKNKTKAYNELSVKYEMNSQQMKLSFNTQLTALKKQRQYFQNCNESNKRKHLATQYLFVSHEKMFKKNAKDIYKSVQKNTSETMDELKGELIELLNNKTKKMKVSHTLDISGVIRNNLTNSDEYYTKAKKVLEKHENGSVKCPDCERIFDGITNLKKHMTMKHFKQFDSTFDVPVQSNKFQNRVLDSIDLSDD